MASRPGRQLVRTAIGLARERRLGTAQLGVVRMGPRRRNAEHREGEKERELAAPRAHPGMLDAAASFRQRRSGWSAHPPARSSTGMRFSELVKFESR